MPQQRRVRRCLGLALVGEAYAAIELGTTSEAFLDGGHAYDDDAHAMAVSKVADLLEAGGLEPIGFVDDE